MSGDRFLLFGGWFTTHQSNPDNNKWDFELGARWAEEARSHESEQWMAAGIAALHMLKQYPEFANGLAQRGSIPIGSVGGTSEVATLVPGQHSLIISGEYGRDPLGDSVLATIAQAQQHLHKKDPMSGTILGTVKNAEPVFMGMKRVLHQYPVPTSPVRVLASQGNEGLLTEVLGYKNPRAGMVDRIAHTLAQDPESLAAGYTQGVVPTNRFGEIPIIGAENTVILDQVQPKEFAEDLGLSMEFLLEQLQYTPMAHIVRGVARLVMHISITDLLSRQKSSWISAMNSIFQRGQVQPIITGSALARLPQIQRQTGWRLPEFQQPYEKAKDVGSFPVNTVLVPNAEEVEADVVVPFRPQE